MKTFINSVFSVLVITLLAIVVNSCSDTVDQISADPIDNIGIQFNLTKEAKNEVDSRVKKLFSGTRSSNFSITEGEAKEALSPLIPVGKSIRDQIMSEVYNGNLALTIDEIQQLNEMNESELVLFAYCMYEIQYALTDVDLTIFEEGNGYQISKQDLWNCFTAAIGFELAASLWSYLTETGSLIGAAGAAADSGLSAAAAWRIGRALIGRTLGWVGVAFTLYQYADCLRTHASN